MTQSEDFPAPTNETPSQGSNSLEEIAPKRSIAKGAQELQPHQVMSYEEFVQEDPSEQANCDEENKGQ